MSWAFNLLTRRGPTERQTGVFALSLSPRLSFCLVSILRKTSLRPAVCAAAPHYRLPLFKVHISDNS